MSSVTPNEFHWLEASPAGGDSGVGLADLFMAMVQECTEVENICDLGCGNGYMAGRLADLGFNVTGIDASESGIRIAMERHDKPRFIRSQIDASISDRLRDRFDLVISSDVIEHMYRPADLLEAAASLLEPGGHLLLGTPYHGYLKNLVLSLTGQMDSHFCVLADGGHIKFFSVKTLSNLIVSHDFELQRFRYYGRGPWVWKNMICHARKRKA